MFPCEHASLHFWSHVKNSFESTDSKSSLNFNCEIVLNINFSALDFFPSKYDGLVLPISSPEPFVHPPKPVHMHFLFGYFVLYILCPSQLFVHCIVQHVKFIDGLFKNLHVIFCWRAELVALNTLMPEPASMLSPSAMRSALSFSSAMFVLCPRKLHRISIFSWDSTAFPSLLAGNTISVQIFVRKVTVFFPYRFKPLCFS